MARTLHPVPDGSPPTARRWLIGGAVLVMAATVVAALATGPPATSPPVRSSVAATPPAPVALIEGDTPLSFLIGALTGVRMDRSIITNVADAADAGHPEPFGTVEGISQRLQDVAFSPDGALMAAAGPDDASIVLWRVSNGRIHATLADRPTTGRGPVTRLAFSADGRSLASGHASGSVVLWDVRRASEVRRIATGNSISALGFSRDGRRLAVASLSGELALWDVATGRTLVRLGGDAGWVRSVVLSADGKLVAAGRADGGVDVWETATGRRHATLPLDAPVEHLAFSPDSALLAIGTLNRAVLWNVEVRSVARTLVVPFWVQHVAFARKGQTLIAVNNTGTLREWRVTDGGKVRSVPLSPSEGWFGIVRLSADGRTVATVPVDGDQTTRDIGLWRIPTDPRPARARPRKAGGWSDPPRRRVADRGTVMSRYGRPTPIRSSVPLTNV
jgi:WD40 repeat protein